MLRAYRATAPAELQELLRDECVAAPDDPVMQELAPVTRQQLLQLWQDTLQLVQGGSGAGEERAQSWGCVPEVPALKWRLEVLYGLPVAFFEK